MGNTAVSIGLFEGGRLFSKTSIPTKECEKELGKKIMKLHPHLSPPPLRGRKRWRGDLFAIVGSVVPKIDKIVKTNLRQSGIRYRFVKPIDCGIPIRCRKPAEVGVDRLLNVVASRKLYKKGAIIVDCGTATTFDVVSPRGEYLGGAIAPGIRIGTEALAQNCAKLFQVRLTLPQSVIGKDTREAMLSGIMLGHISMIEGMVARIKRELNFKPVIIGTGGFFQLVAKKTKIFDVIDLNLTLKGLAIVARNRK